MADTIVAMDEASLQGTQCSVLREIDRWLLSKHGDVCGRGGTGIHFDVYLV